MSVSAPADNETFKVCIFKSHNYVQSREFVNSYELVASNGAEFGDIQTAVEKIAEFERQIHLNIVGFNRYTISTWQPDSTPYNPQNLFTHQLSTVGAREVSNSNVLALQAVLSIKRLTSFGKCGRIAYRGCLTEAQTDGTSGTIIYSNPTEIASMLSDALGNSHIGDLWDVDGKVRLALVSSGTYSVQHVTGLVVGKPSFHKVTRNRKKKTT